MSDDYKSAEFEFTIRGDYYEDRDLLKTISQLHEYHSTMHEIDEKIRARLKWGEEPLSESDCKLFEEIRSMLWPLLDR